MAMPITSGRSDGPTVRATAADLAKRTGAQGVRPAGLIQTMIDLGWVSAEQGIRFGQGRPVKRRSGPQIKITQVRAEHSSEVTLVDPRPKKTHTYPAVSRPASSSKPRTGFKLYHMGDTGLFGDMRLIGEYLQARRRAHPIGGHFVMDPRDAAYATGRC